MATMPPNPFEVAPEMVNEISDHVMGHQNTLIERAETTRDAAANTIAQISSALKSINPGFAGMPKAPDFPAWDRHNITLPELPQDSFGKISAPCSGTFRSGDVGDLENVDIKPFDPKFDQLNIPDAPDGPKDIDLPDKPSLSAVARPTGPSISYPTLPSLTELVIPDYTFQKIPEFKEVAPEYEGKSITSVLQWAPTEYAEQMLTETMQVIRRMWGGGTGLPPAVEQALWERAAGREDMAVARDISASIIEFSGRGYTLPPGVLVNRIDTLRTESMLKKQSLQRDITIKIADTHIENLRFACQQAIAVETVLVGMWEKMAQLSFEAAKAQLDSEIAVCNVQVAIFNAKQAAYQTKADVYKAVLQALVTEAEIYKAQLQAEIAKGEINEQRVKAYIAQYEGIKAQIEVFKAEMQGAQLEAEVQRLEVETYKAGVEAAGEELRADLARFTVYEAQMRGETAKAQVLEAHARGYSAYVSGVATNAEINIKQHAARMQEQELRLREFLGNLEVDKTRLQAESAVIQATAEAHRTNAARFTAEANAQAVLAEVDIKSLDAEIRNLVAVYDVEVRKYMNANEQLIRAATLEADGLKAIGQMHSTMAAGAMAGISLGANVGADARIAASGNSSVNTNINYHHNAE